MIHQSYKVLSRMKEQDGGKVYQGAELHNCDNSVIESCKRQALSDIKSLDEQMKNRLKWSDLDFPRSVLAFLDTQSWDNSDDDTTSEIQAALSVLALLFIVYLK